MSSVALFDRLRKFAPLFKQMCNSLMRENQLLAESGNSIRLVDATNIKEPGPTGSLWRVHYSFALDTMVCAFAKLTEAKGAGSSETLTHFPINQGDLLIADRGYSQRKGISYAKDRGGEVCIRLNHAILPIFSAPNCRIDLQKRLESYNAKSGEIIEFGCSIKHSDNKSYINGRICAIKKDDINIEEALKKLMRTRSKKSMSPPKAETIYLNQYIILFTTFDAQKFTAKKVLELYRWRWQVELVFKRFKSLLSLGHLPKTTSESSQAWLYGKLLIALLIEKISALNGAFSPWRDSGDGLEKQSVAYIRFCYACYPAVDFTEVQFEEFSAIME